MELKYIIPSSLTLAFVPFCPAHLRLFDQSTHSVLNSTPCYTFVRPSMSPQYPSTLYIGVMTFAPIVHAHCLDYVHDLTTKRRPRADLQSPVGNSCL